MTTEAPLLEARSLSRAFDVGTGGFGLRRRTLNAVDDVSFALTPGKVTALVGQSGSGKSTIARLLLRLYAPTSGSILLGEEDVSRIRGRRNLRRYRSQVQMIFQDPFAISQSGQACRPPHRRPLRRHKVVPSSLVAERVRELLDSVGLTPPDVIAAKYPHELSGGQSQRVAIARALAVEPKVVIADEPVSMLDVSIRLGVLNLILELKERRNLGVPVHHARSRECPVRRGRDPRPVRRPGRREGPDGPGPPRADPPVYPAVALRGAEPRARGL